jgi:hypothetical protein
MQTETRYQAFQNSAQQMKRFALAAHSLSSLYATVIDDVINPGFSLVIQASHHVSGSSELVVAQKQAGMQQYLLAAEDKCRQSSKEVRRHFIISNLTTHFVSDINLLI